MPDRLGQDVLKSSLVRSDRIHAVDLTQQGEIFGRKMEVRKWEDLLMTVGRSDAAFGLGDVGPMDLPANLHLPTSIFLPNCKLSRRLVPRFR